MLVPIAIVYAKLNFHRAVSNICYRKQKQTTTNKQTKNKTKKKQKQLIINPKEFIFKS
jgi:tRNA C32,U32 (ribose-2'-O)-methylase TrmJ